LIKLTVLYGHPLKPEDFESYYATTHRSLAGTIPGVNRMELTQFVGGPDGSKPPFYRMAELYFADEKQMQASLGSPEGQVTVADLNNFATGGVTIAVGIVQQ